MRTLEKLLLAAVTAIALTACGSAVPLKDDAVKTTVVDTKPDPDIRCTCCGGPSRPDPDPLEDPNGVLAKRTIYFDFDSNGVKEEFRPLLEAHARYLINYKSRSILLTGHADDRGGREYNLALGDKRAEAVRAALAVFGVPVERLESVSYGKEKPAAEGDDEASWALNRRVELEYRN